MPVFVGNGSIRETIDAAKRVEHFFLAARVEPPELHVSRMTVAIQGSEVFLLQMGDGWGVVNTSRDVLLEDGTLDDCAKRVVQEVVFERIDAEIKRECGNEQG